MLGRDSETTDEEFTLINHFCRPGKAQMLCLALDTGSSTNLKVSGALIAVRFTPPQGLNASIRATIVVAE